MFCPLEPLNSNSTLCYTIGTSTSAVTIFVFDGNSQKIHYFWLICWAKVSVQEGSSAFGKSDSMSLRPQHRELLTNPLTADDYGLSTRSSTFGQPNSVNEWFEYRSIDI